MTLLLSFVFALALAIALVVAARFWFNRVQKAREVTAIGIEVLAARSWREAMNLMVKALEVDGIVASAELTDPAAAPSGERVLRRGNRSVLLVYKHGTTYRIGQAAVRDVELRREKAGIDEALLATLGQVDDEAKTAAKTMGVELLDAAGVWQKVESLLEERVRADVAREAEEKVRGPRTMATLGATFLGVVIVFFGSQTGERLATFGETSATPSTATAQQQNSANPAAQNATTTEDNQPGIEVPAMSEEAAASVRRAALAQSVMDVSGVERASWSTSTTLVISLSPRVSAESATDAICAMATLYPEVRESRLQFDSVGAETRWRRCP
jgi:hypothetical protein